MVDRQSPGTGALAIPDRQARTPLPNTYYIQLLGVNFARLYSLFRACVRIVHMWTVRNLHSYDEFYQTYAYRLAHQLFM